MTVKKYTRQKGDLFELATTTIKGNADDVYIGSFVMLDGAGYLVPTKDEGLADAYIKRPIYSDSESHLGWVAVWIGNVKKCNKTEILS